MTGHNFVNFASPGTDVCNPRPRIPSSRSLHLTSANVFTVIAMVFFVVGTCGAFEGKPGDKNCDDLEESEKIPCYFSVLENDPCDRDAFLGLIWAYGEGGTAEDLLETLASLSSIAPDVPHFYQMRALILEQMGDLDAAKREKTRAEGLKRCIPTEDEEMEMALPLPPTSENAEKILERAHKRYSRMKDYEGALRDYETYLGIVSQPDSPSVYRNLAGARRQTGDTAGAIQALSMLISVFPEQREATLSTRARLYRELGDYSSAEEDLADLESLKNQRLDMEIAQFSSRIEQNPEDYWAYYERGKKRLSNHDLAGAIEDATDAIRLAPSFGNAYRLRAEARAQVGDQEGAEIDRAAAAKCAQDQH